MLQKSGFRIKVVHRYFIDSSRVHLTFFVRILPYTYRKIFIFIVLLAFGQGYWQHVGFVP